MSDFNDPRSQYNEYRNGEPGGRFETDARTSVHPMQTVVNVTDEGEAQPLHGLCTIDVSKPDPRLSVEFSLGYVPRDTDVNALVTDVTGNGQTVQQNLADSRVWLALLSDFGGGVVEDEDVVGTRAALVTFVSPGLWGVTWEVDLDVVGVRATVDLVSAGVFGRWMVGARWTALEPMSQRDWEHARQNMNCVVTPGRIPALGVLRNVGF